MGVPNDDGTRAGTLPRLRWPAILAVAIVLLTAGIFALFGPPPSSVPGTPALQLNYCQQTDAMVRIAPSAPAELPRISGNAQRIASPQQAPEAYFILDNGTNRSVSGQSCYEFTVSVAATNLVVGDTAFEIKTVDCAPVSQPLAIQFVQPSGGLLASENVSTRTWTAGANMPVSVGDRVIVDTLGPLSGAELVSNVTYEGSDTQSGMLLGSYPGGWEGCNF